MKTLSRRSILLAGAALAGLAATPALAGTVSSDLIPIGSGTQWAALSPDGTMMATSNRGTNNVTIINLADNSTQTVSVGSYDVNNLQGIVLRLIVSAQTSGSSQSRLSTTSVSKSCFSA